MICRVWHGWTTPEHAGEYEQLLLSEILPGIKGRGIKGFIEADVIKRRLEGEVEFVTLCWFDSMEAVEEFTGGTVEKSVVPGPARKLLKRFDEEAIHFNVARKGGFSR